MKKYFLKFDRKRRFDYAVDLKSFYKKYQTPEKGYKLLVGTPILVNIQGTYVDISNLADIYVGPAKLLYEYISGIKMHDGKNEVWNLRWV